ncbi:hypothetical protein [Scytonema millei]|uniref:Uncharacterized protein n=1 Tax=Scytonema millei VB511283 TaxID=1245923 RepID=A0A9X5EF96_9CYAN|nr:hypothetical protein [Scytonema millei]NHC38269.1 hypothetical protein [Scytonema millei VB511283]
MSVVSCQLSGSKEQGAESRGRELRELREQLKIHAFTHSRIQNFPTPRTPHPLYDLRLTTSDLFLANYLLKNREV